MTDLNILQDHVRFGDPHVTSDDADRLSILSNVFEALVARTADGSFVPILARSWTLSDDARTWHFDLRDNVRFHDGKPFDADDVVRSLRRVRDEAVGGELGTTGVISSYLRDVRIAGDSAYGVQLSTQEPMADLLDLLADIPILSDESIEALSRGEYIGTGRYRIVDYNAYSVRMALVESDRRTHRFCPERLSWSSIEYDDERRERFSRRERTIIAGVTPDSAKRLERLDKAMIIRSQTSVCATFMFNLLSGVATSRALRRAINYAIDVDSIIADVAGGEAVALKGPMTSQHLGFNPNAPGFPYDPDLARSLIDDAGLDQPIELVLDVPTTLPDEARDLAIILSEYLAAVGITVDIRVHEDRPAYAETVRTKQINDAACFDSSPVSTFRLLREKFHSGVAGPWWLGYDNRYVNELIDRASRTADIETRRVLYQKAFAMISDDAPWVFLYNPYRLTAISETLAEDTSPAGWSPTTGGLLKFR
ncbi:MAG: ABC transporter substrate-binding protein [Rhodothermales bacterium]|nr:ABC transporter substrate-binding protein [Rhodothermales bacterium]